MAKFQKLKAGLGLMSLYAGNALADMTNFIPKIEGSEKVMSDGKLVSWFGALVSKGLWLLVVIAGAVICFSGVKTVQHGIQKARLTDGTLTDAFPLFVLALIEVGVGLGLLYLASYLLTQYGAQIG